MTKLLDALVRKPQPAVRYSLNDYVSWVSQSFMYGGNQYPLNGYQTTQPESKVEPIGTDFVGYVEGGLKSNGIVWTCANVRMQVFAQARFMFQRIRQGRPGDLFGTMALAELEQPWPGGTTGDLLAQMILHADFAGNAYVTRDDQGNLGTLRPDWVDIVLTDRYHLGRAVGYEKFGYAYYENGYRDRPPVGLALEDVAHFAPYPDPTASFRGMSWLTPVLREVVGDKAMSIHKVKYFENAATPNLVIAGIPAKDPKAFDEWIASFEAGHKGVNNANKTLYLTSGADVTVAGANLQQIDFRAVQGSGETRIAAASGVGAIIAQFSEGMQGSSLNAGNYGAARRRFSDIPMRHAWQNASGSLQTLIQTPSDARLWYDSRDIPFLQEDAKDAADIWAVKAQAMSTLISAGYKPDSVTAATAADDETLLVHTGLPSVQLQPAALPAAAPANGDTPAPDMMPAN